MTTWASSHEPFKQRQVQCGYKPNTTVPRIHPGPLIAVLSVIVHWLETSGGLVNWGQHTKYASPWRDMTTPIHPTPTHESLNAHRTTRYTVV